MKKIYCLFLIIITNVLIIKAAETPTKKFLKAEPDATLQKMWVDYDVTKDGRIGMLMHVAFTVYNMKGVDGVLGFLFRYRDGKTGSYIRHNIPDNKNDKYHTTTGILSVFEILKPNYDVSIYDDIAVFMPYEEIKIAPGTYDLTIDVEYLKLTTTSQLIVASLDMYDFEFSKADNSRGPDNKAFTVKTRQVPTTGPRAVFDSLWVNFDVKENNELGMNIHFKFVAYNMKDTPATVAIYFMYNTYEMKTLRDKNQKFVSGSGDVAVYMDINPGYDTAYYNDFVIFMPYAEFDLAPGTYELLMDTKVIYRRGGLISNFAYQPFRYTEAAK